MDAPKNMIKVFTAHIVSAWVGMQTSRKASGSLVGVCMVDVVLDPPGLERVDEGGEHEGAHNVLHKLVLAEGAVPAVMPHHKELHSTHSPLMPVITCSKWHT